MTTRLIVLTGASGSGKTTLAKAVEATGAVTVLYFDSLGVPVVEVMASYGPEHQPGGAWQRAMTFKWFECIADLLHEERPILFEGQMRPAFIAEALAACGTVHASVRLVDCSEEVRLHRLRHHRRQPELADDDMLGWARYLRLEAQEKGYSVLDTGAVPFQDTVEHLLQDLTG